MTDEDSISLKLCKGEITIDQALDMYNFQMGFRLTAQCGEALFRRLEAAQKETK